MSQLRRFDQIIGGTTGEANEIAYDNSTSGLNANNVQGAIDEVNSDLSELKANDLGTHDVVTYATESSPYTATADGWLMLYTNEASTISVRIKSATNNTVFSMKSSGGDTASVFLKKGMRMYVYSHTGGVYGAEYYPLD